MVRQNPALLARASELLVAHPLFSGIDPGAIERLCRFMHLVQARKGKALFRKGDPGSFLMLVVEGAVKIVSTTADGHEGLLNVIKVGGVFGEIALLDGEPRTADAIAAADCSLLVMDRRDVIPFLEKNPKIAVHLIGALCKTLRRVSDHLESVMFLDAPARLARALLRFNGEQGDTVALTQRELGQAIGSARETVNQQLQSWQSQGLVRLEKGRVVILDPQAIENISEGAGAYR